MYQPRREQPPAHAPLAVLRSAWVTAAFGPFITVLALVLQQRSNAVIESPRYDTFRNKGHFRCSVAEVEFLVQKDLSRPLAPVHRPDPLNIPQVLSNVNQESSRARSALSQNLHCDNFVFCPYKRVAISSKAPPYVAFR